MPTPTATIFLPYHALDDVIQRGTRAAQPAAADVVPGTLYGVTDEGDVVERSNGTVWEAYGPTGGGGGAPAAHHATHEPGGSDALLDAAWTDAANIFAADQTVDGDLFVTGTVNPLSDAQRDQINALIGDPTGARTLMSSSFVSGLSLRHDEAVARGRIACGNYDTQTYQPLAFEVEALEVHTGVSPASRVEHVRVHPLGGLTVGEGADHATDPGVGIIRARGLDGTPLDATSLLSGTIPDARLSANVQMKPIALADLPPTVATTPIDLATETTGTLPVARLGAGTTTVVMRSDTGTVNDWVPGLAGNTWIEWVGGADLTVTGIAGGVPGQLVTLKNLSGHALFCLHFSAASVNPNRLVNAVSLATPVSTYGWVTYLFNGIEQRWELVAHDQGPWITPPFNAADFAGDSGTILVEAGDVAEYGYALHGTTLQLTLKLVFLSVSGGPSFLMVRLPLGFVPARSVTCLNPVILDNTQQFYTAGILIVTANDAQILIGRLDRAAWQASTNNTFVYLQASIPVQ